LGPATVEEARLWLSDLAAAQIKRLEYIRAQNQEIADADLADAPAWLAMEPGPDGERERRYTLSRDRAFNRSVDLFLKLRNMSEAGRLDRIDRENPALPDEADDRSLPVTPDPANDRPEILGCPSVGMTVEWDGERPAGALAQACEVVPNLDSAAPAGRSESEQSQEIPAVCAEEPFLRNEPTEPGRPLDETVLPLDKCGLPLEEPKSPLGASGLTRRDPGWPLAGSGPRAMRKSPAVAVTGARTKPKVRSPRGPSQHR
jgi:hypothetical protein